MGNLALRFILELCPLAALGYWGFRTGNGWILKIFLGFGAPLLAAVVWGSFVSPKATYEIGQFGRLIIEAVVFGSASLALYASGHTRLCLIFIAAAVISRTLLFIFKS
ncbi:hypothetical protein AF332_18080 [Sporosarcina globispora]|uniref:DUF2568 domain-containing protein n=2 Tax=Sporosarcina globispora TaxID=1459 RepID=A0A0M0GLJ2_SPOGL|nr:hypothetical protein AF332_18080 [Sporosarcina globispora]